MRSFIVGMALLATLLAGCASEATRDPVGTETPPVVPLGEVLQVSAPLLGNFTKSIVDVAVSYGNDLYEPTIEVSETGVIYITGHTILVDTTGAPVYYSKDDGATWAQLPFLGSATMPGTVHGATPPPSDEIFLAAGDDGWLYGVDITLFTYPVNAWKGDGAELAYHNPNAYDESRNAQQATDCVALPVKDRPWAAYENGTLLMVSNPAGGPAQVGVMQVPPALAAGVSGQPYAQWNMCAGPGGSIPGIPDIRADGLFAVPQRSNGALHLVLGNKADVMDTRTVQVFPHTSRGEITSVYGIAAFDAEGTLFVGISNNTQPDAKNNQVGQLRFALSQDGAQNLTHRTFVVADKAVRHFYLDANERGPGALAVWAVEGAKEGGYDWFTAHVQVGADGAPVLENVTLAIENGPRPSAHVTGAAVGPDGRAYLAMYEPVPRLGTPLSVYVQGSGPALPVTLA